MLAPFVLPGERVRVRGVEKPGCCAPACSKSWPPLRTRGAALPLFRAVRRMPLPACAYESQLALKRRSWRTSCDASERSRRPEIVVSPASLGYRNRVQLHIAERELGYLEAQSHKLCPIAECPIASPAINAAIATLREMLARSALAATFSGRSSCSPTKHEMQLNVLETEQSGSAPFLRLVRGTHPWLVSGALDYPAAGYTWRVSPARSSRSTASSSTAHGDAPWRRGGSRPRSTYTRAWGCSRCHWRALRLRDRGGIGRPGGGRSARQRGTRRLASGVEQTDAEVSWNSCKPLLTSCCWTRPAPAWQEHGRDLNRLASPRMAIVSCDPATLARDLAALTNIDRATDADRSVSANVPSGNDRAVEAIASIFSA